jgi:hypothetical protein
MGIYRRQIYRPKRRQGRVGAPATATIANFISDCTATLEWSQGIGASGVALMSCEAITPFTVDFSVDFGTTPDTPFTGDFSVDFGG